MTTWKFDKNLQPEEMTSFTTSEALENTEQQFDRSTQHYYYSLSQIKNDNNRSHVLTMVDVTTGERQSQNIVLPDGAYVFDLQVRRQESGPFNGQVILTILHDIGGRLYLTVYTHSIPDNSLTRLSIPAMNLVRNKNRALTSDGRIILQVQGQGDVVLDLARRTLTGVVSMEPLPPYIIENYGN